MCERVTTGGVALDRLTEAAVVERVADALSRGEGGHIVTPNVDIVRAASRDPSLCRLIASAEISVADGMPLVWAARLLGRPVPERVAGADLIWSLTAMAAAGGHPVYLLGGAPGVPRRAAAALSARHPGLEVAGADAPPYGFDRTEDGVRAVRLRLAAARPRLVFVGLGFPRQDLLIRRLRPELPGTWFVGCGAAIGFAAGTVRRAPGWMRRTGLEWLHRLSREPGRLAGRYLVDDLPFAALLLGRAVLSASAAGAPIGRRSP